MSSRARRLRHKKSTPSRAATEFQRKFIRGFLILIGITLVIIFIFGDHGVYQLMRLKQERKATQALITQLREQRKQLEDEKFKLDTNLEYIERLARERYRMAKKGEKVFKVIPKNDNN